MRDSPYLVVLAIGGLVAGLYLAAFGIAVLLGLPWDLGAPLSVRLVGLAPLAYGIGMLAWVVRFRGARAVLESTWVTFRKLVGRLPLEVRGGRTEPLVVAGPYRLVRHPLYSGVGGLTLGISLLTDRPWAYLGCAFLVLWFVLVLAPFEERELRALFGAPYEEYMRRTRRFVPIPRHP